MSKHPRVQAWACGWGINIATFIFCLAAFWIMPGSLPQLLLSFLVQCSLFLVFLPFALVFSLKEPDFLQSIVSIVTELSLKTKIIGFSFFGVWWLSTLIALVVVRKKYKNDPFFTPVWGKDLATSSFFSSLLTLGVMGMIVLLGMGKALSSRY